MNKKIFALALAIIICAACIMPALAVPPYRPYIYDWATMPVAAPNPYTCVQEITGVSLGIGQFDTPTDLLVDSKGYVYILDSKNNRIIILDEELKLYSKLDYFIYEGPDEQFRTEGPTRANPFDFTRKSTPDKVVQLNNPQGFCLSYDETMLYVCDTSNHRIVRVNLNGVVDRVFGKPDFSNLIDSKTEYNPTKVTVDSAGRMFVVARTINRGLIKLDKEGNFDIFFGAPMVVYDPFQIMMRMFSTREQIAAMQKFAPTEYSNVMLDKKGFIWTVTKEVNKLELVKTFKSEPNDPIRSQVAPVRRLAADGTDILTRNGLAPPVGDINISNEAKEVADSKMGLMAVSAFVDITLDEYGIYSCLDAFNGRVFSYDSEGNLLFIFGNTSSQVGTFVSAAATAISYHNGNDIIVLDSNMKSIQVFKPTDYGSMVLAAVHDYINGEYYESEIKWNKVLKMNSNMTQAYLGRGKSLLRSGDFANAMADFKIARSKVYYSKALAKQMTKTIGSKFTIIFIGIIGLWLLWQIWKMVKRLRLFFRDGVKKVL